MAWDRDGLDWVNRAGVSRADNFRDVRRYFSGTPSAIDFEIDSYHIGHRACRADRERPNRDAVYRQGKQK